MQPINKKKHFLNTDSFITFSCMSLGLFIEIETKSLYIRSYRHEDFENCVELYGDAKITRYFDHGKPRSREEVEDLIDQKGLKYFMQGQPFGLFSIFEKKENAFIGQLDFLPSDRPGVVEIGCILHRKYHNQGFPKELIRVFIMVLTDEINSTGLGIGKNSIETIIATVHPKNLPSQRTLEQFGMTFDRCEDRFGAPRLWYSYNIVQRGAQ